MLPGTIADIENFVNTVQLQVDKRGRRILNTKMLKVLAKEMARG